MEKILSNEWVKDINHFSTEVAKNEFLNSESDHVRGKGAILIGTRFNENYEANSTLLLDEMNKDIHFLNVRLGVKSAWTIAITLIENLKEKDYYKLKNQFKRWKEEEQKDLISWLKDFPSHISILQGDKNQ